jgi:hypothetical protein
MKGFIAALVIAVWITVMLLGVVGRRYSYEKDEYAAMLEETRIEYLQYHPGSEPTEEDLMEWNNNLYHNSDDILFCGFMYAIVITVMLIVFGIIFLVGGKKAWAEISRRLNGE